MIGKLIDTCEKQQKSIIVYALNVILFVRLNKYHISSHIPQRTGMTNHQSLHREIQEAQLVTDHFTYTAGPYAYTVDN